MEWKEKRKEEVDTLKVYGKQVMCRLRDDKTEVKSLALPKNKKGEKIVLCSSTIIVGTLKHRDAIAPRSVEHTPDY
jgi:hypothetical protein